MGASTLVAASGEYSDFQYLMDLLSELDTGEAVLADGARMKAPEVHAYLTRVLSNRRLKVDPLWNTLLVAGPDAAGEPRLGYVDLRGTAFCDDYAATGYGAYMALPLIRERWAPGMDEGAARALLEDCMRVLWARDCKALNRIQIAKVTRAGETAVSEPYVVHATWDYAAFVQPKAGSDTGGSW